MSAAAPINFVEWAIKGAGVWDMGGYNGTWLVFFLRSWRVKRQSKKADTHKPKPNRKKKSNCCHGILTRVSHNAMVNGKKLACETIAVPVPSARPPGHCRNKGSS